MRRDGASCRELAGDKGEVLPLRGAIVSLHARYEAAGREAEAIERIEDDRRSDPVLAAGLAEALAANRAERQALRLALLHQSPSCWSEALVLAHHLYGAMGSAGSEIPPSLRLAGESLFDFLASTVDQDHEPLGEGFQAATVEAFLRRRLRTGRIEP